MNRWKFDDGGLLGLEPARLDERALLREARRRFGCELAAAISSMDRALAREDPLALARGIERLRSVDSLHRTLTVHGGPVRIDDAVTSTCMALAGCGDAPEGAPIDVSVAVAAVDGRVACAVALTVVALLAGDVAGGPIPVDGRVEVDVDVDPLGVSVAVRDMGDDPPDRREVGGALLRRVMAAANASCDALGTPGLAIVRVRVPATDVLPLEVAGHA